MRKGAIAAVAGLVLLAGALVIVRAAGGSDDLISRPWTRAEVSDDGQQLTVWVEPPGDPGCEEFERIDVDRDGSTAVIRALYRRTDQVGCIVPCPIQDEARTIALDDPLSGVSLTHDPDAVPSCR